MLEIKPFDAWSETNATTDRSEKIKQYADYVRVSAYKNGQFDENSEQEIQRGIYERAVFDGLISEDEPEEDKVTKMRGLATPTQNKDADAQFLLDHYQQDFDASSPEFTEKAPTIQRYFALKQTSPEQVGGLQTIIDGYVGDSNAVKEARLSAVDRGDYRVVSVEEAGGRQLYTGADTKPENLNGELDSLLSNGAITPSDLGSVRGLTAPINGGLSTVAEGTRYSVFSDALNALAKKDPTLRSSIDQEASRIREAKRESQMTMGESIFETVKEVVAVPFDAVANVVSSAFGMSRPQEEVATPRELISGYKAFAGRHSETEVDRFLGDYLKNASGPVYRADRPETGIDVDSLGTPIISPALIGNKAQFEKALSLAPLNDDQKERATISRMASLEVGAPKLLNLILGESDEATSSFAVAKAAGKTDAEFVEEWVSNNSQNYDGMSERLQQVGLSTFSAIATLPVGVAALMGFQPAAKALVALNKEQSDREEYARLFGDEFGLGFQLVNTIPQVATDVLATIGSGGLYTAAKTIARGGAKAITREALRGSVSMVDGATATLVKNAAEAGGESLVSSALKDVGTGLASKLARADSLVPLFAVSFTRSASATYGSIYGQLPKDMSHDEKHRNAFGYAIAAGLSTAVITSGMSFLGAGAVEDLATGAFRPLTLADDAATNVRKVPLSELNYKQAKFLYENLENAGAKLADKEFQRVLRNNIGGAYKNYLRTVLKGGVSEGFEESFDQALQIRIEDAALDKTTPLAERVSQITNAFALGGILGGAVPAVRQFTAPLQQSEVSLALDARASVLSKVANDLRKTGSNATAEVLQRQLNEAQAAAAKQKQLEIAAQQQKADNAKVEEVFPNEDKPLSFDPVGQAELELNDTRSTALPQATRFLSEFDGERAYVGSYAGTLERDGDSVRLKLDEARADGVEYITVGSRFQPLARSGVRLDRKGLLVTGAHSGTIPAGTPYVAMGPRRSERFALPSDASNVSLIANTADAPILRIEGARKLGQENIVSPIILTDKGQIEDALRYYNLEFAELSKPENTQQLELSLFDDAPDVEPASTPVANPTAVVTPPVKAKTKGKTKGKDAKEPDTITPELVPTADEVVADAMRVGVVVSQKAKTKAERYVASLIKSNKLGSSLLASYKKNEVSGLSAALEADVADLADLRSRLDQAKDYALGLDDGEAEARLGILNSVMSLQTLLDVAEVEFGVGKTPAAKEATPVEPTEELDDYETLSQMLSKDIESAGPLVDRFGDLLTATGYDPQTQILDYTQDGVEYTTAIRFLNLDGNKDAIAAYRAANTPTLDDITPTPTPTQKRKQVTAKKVSATTLPDTFIVDNPEDLLEQEALLEAELAELSSVVPVFDMDGRLTTLESLEVELQTLNSRIEAARGTRPVVSGTLDYRKRLQDSIKQAQALVGVKANEIKAKIATISVEDPNVDKTTDEEKHVADLLDIINGKTSPTPTSETPVKKTTTKVKAGVGPVGFTSEQPPILVYKKGLFRNDTEAQLFSQWVAGGFLITNLAAHGYDSRKVSGIPLTTKGAGAASYDADIKRRLYEAVVARFPLIPIPKGTATTPAKSKSSSMLGGGRKNLSVPVKKDKDDKIIAGVFTNDPIVTALQIDLGLRIVADAATVKSKGFNLNESIVTRELKGGALEVISVKRYPNDKGVFNKGDMSLVGKSGYTPLNALKGFGNMLRPPASEFLNGAGRSARNKVRNTFDAYLEDAIAVSQDTRSASRRSTFGRYEGLFTIGLGLDSENGSDAVSEALIIYSNSLKEFSLGKRIEKALSRTRQLNPEATLFDIDIPRIILDESISKGGKTPLIKDVARAIAKVHPVSLRSPESALRNYGTYLYESVTSGKMSVGVKTFHERMVAAGIAAQLRQIRRDSKVRSPLAQTQKEFDAVLDSLVAPDSDTFGPVMRRADEDALEALVSTLRQDTEAYDNLFLLVKKTGKIDLDEQNIDETELVSLAGRLLLNSTLEGSVQFERALARTTVGLRLTNLLIDAGWVSTTRGEVLTPREAEGIPKPSPLPRKASRTQMQRRIKEARVDFSMGSGQLLAAEARKVNNAEIARMGLVSNKPDSVIEALRNIQESGTDMQRLVAGVLLANKNLIRNTRFAIGDMNDVRFAGAFLSKSNLVLINLSGHNGRGVIDVLLHEYLHAVTIQTMTNPTTTEQVAALQRITALRNLTAAQAAKIGFDTTPFTSALESDLEFITYALTAPEFQSLVRAATPTGQRSLFTRICEALRTLFGLTSVDKKTADAFDELLDFTQMFAGSNTFNIDSIRDLNLDAAALENTLNDFRELAQARKQLRGTPEVLFAESGPTPQQMLNAELPKGFSSVSDDNLKGIASVARRESNVLRYNQKYLADMVDGLSPNAAKARIRGLVTHELAHFSALNSFTPEQITRVAAELTEDQLQQTAEQYYATSGAAADAIVENVAADRASGILSNERIADEWIRMQVEKAANGRTYEDIVRTTNGKESLLSTLAEAIRAFVTRLRQRFADYPSAETAASVSHAARMLRKINKSKAIDFDARPYADGVFEDSTKLFASLDGAPVEDQVSYAIPIASSNASKVDALNTRLRLYNLPPELRDIINERGGAANQITTASKSLVRYFPKLRDNALKGGVDMEDIKTLFGTTAPPLTDADLKDIADMSLAYEATIPNTETAGRKADLVAEYGDKLKRERRLRFNEAFTKRQAAAEQSIRDAGFAELVDRAVLFRKDINKNKEAVGFDESNDVYLTRAYKFFNTEGWALAAKAGGTIKIEGQEVDFDKLRAHAAAAYYEEAEAEFLKLGKPYSTRDVDELTLNKLDNYLSTLETMTVSADKQTMDSLRKDLNRFKPKKDIDSTFRELLGEIEDPLANAVNTAFRVGMLAANEQFKTNFSKTAIDLGLASTERVGGWSVPFAASSSKTMGGLAGLYFDPKVAGVLNEMFGANMNGLVSHSTGLLNGLGRAVMGVSGVAIQMKTQLGIGYWPRNGIGGYVMSAAQGILLNPFVGKGREARKASFQAAFSTLGTDEEQRAAVLRLVQLNILNDQVMGRAAQDLLKGVISTPEQDLQALVAAVDEARITNDVGGVVARLKSQGYIKGGFAKALAGYSNVTDFLAALDGALDGVFKANAYYYELGVIQQHFGNTMTLEAQEEAAALKVKRVFAGHSQVIDIVKSFNKTPMAAVFLPFARWKSEVFRTMLNTVPLALEEINQGGVMARRGVRRLVSFTATLTAAPVLVGAMMTFIFRALAGDEEEERELTAVEKAALRESLPSWQRGHQIRAQVLKGGKVQMIDMSYILPHSQLTDLVSIIMDGFKTGEGINGSRLGSYIANDLIGTQIAATALDEVLNNENDRGQPIYLETDNATTKMQRVMLHFGKSAIVPSAVLKGTDFFREGQTNRAELFWGEVLGSRPRTNTFAEIERRGFRNLKTLLDDSVSIIGELSSGRFKDDEGIDAIVDRHQDALNETQRRLGRFQRSLVSMGSPEASVFASAKIYKFSDDTLNSAYQGYRIGWGPNEKWIQKAYFNAEQGKEQDPLQKIQSIYRSVNRKGPVFYVNDAYDE